MRKYYRMMAVVMGIFVLLFTAGNIYIQKMQLLDGDKMYKVSLNRIRQEILHFETEKQKVPESLRQLEQFAGVREYAAIAGMKVLPAEQVDTESLKSFYNGEVSDYDVFFTGRAYYKILYETADVDKSGIIWMVNGMGVLIFLVMAGVLWYIGARIIKPFQQLSELPYELAKGNLSIPLKEQRSRYFGKIVWGMNMLREKLEQQRKRELELHKEKKLLMLSLSHDIKTPLSALKLYAQALGRNLYQSPEKQKEIASRMNEKVDEMEAYIADIVKTSREDFLDLEVELCEIYVKGVLEYIREYYRDKMELSQIAFKIERYSNCLIQADESRLIQVLQNIIENAVKYGDGRRIFIRTECGEEEFTIYVCNTGCTMEKKELAHMYDSFFRGSNVGTQAGSGLGLYICRKLMHRMNGEITARILEEDKERMMELCVAVRRA